MTTRRTTHEPRADKGANVQFRIQLPLDIETPESDLNATARIMVDVVYHAGKWRAHSQQPPVVTVQCDTLDQALVAIAKEILRDAESLRAAP